MESSTPRPAKRLPMDAYDSSGRRISLLSETEEEYFFSDLTFGARAERKYGSDSAASGSIPRTPDLVRSNSIASHSSHPVTPVMPETPFHRRSSDDIMSDAMAAHFLSQSKPMVAPPFQLQPEPQPLSVAPSSPTARRKFPCRLAEEFNCNKRFTTSGHASRHAKIHSQNKHIHCSFEGCIKTFTRTDNMKQHLETHFRGKESGKRGGDMSRDSSRRQSAASSGSHRPSRRSPSLASRRSSYPASAEPEDRRASHRFRSMNLLATAAAQINMDK